MLYLHCMHNLKARNCHCTARIPLSISPWERCSPTGDCSMVVCLQKSDCCVSHLAASALPFPAPFDEARTEGCWSELYITRRLPVQSDLPSHYFDCMRMSCEGLPDSLWACFLGFQECAFAQNSPHANTFCNGHPFESAV